LFVLPGTYPAIAFQFQFPSLLTVSLSNASSFAVHGLLLISGSKAYCQCLWHCRGVLYGICLATAFQSSVPHILTVSFSNASSSGVHFPVVPKLTFDRKKQDVTKSKAFPVLYDMLFNIMKKVPLRLETLLSIKFILQVNFHFLRNNGWGKKLTLEYDMKK
jgi:hypothetical protein